MENKKPILYIFSGLPGSGKTVLSKRLAQVTTSVYFRLDTIEHGIRELCSFDVQGEGYRLTYRMAADNLRIGNNVVVDCCNPWKMTRDEWEEVAKSTDSNFLNMQIVCSDIEMHRMRVEKRKNDIPGFILPAWKEIVNRRYDDWDRERILIDTNGKSEEESFDEMMRKIRLEMEKFV